ncbi:hypothetical protein JCM11491_005173 [Sporobolomyces phaffii]
MTFSPRPRPATVHLALSDLDLTDDYRDVSHSTATTTTHHHHPTGDTPLTARASSTTGTATSRTSVSAGAMSNFDRLLDYLDRDSEERDSEPVPTSTARRHDDSPGSPSPRPGSVAAMRSNPGGERSFLLEKAPVPPPPSARPLHEPDPDDHASVDSIARVAQAALDEFDSTTTTTTTATTARYSPAPSRTYSPSSLAASHRRGVPPENPVQPGLDPHELNLQLLDELREAQDYIAFLQSELRTIGTVVHQLRDRAREEEQGQADVGAASADPAAPTSLVATLGSANERGFELVKHLIAMIPTASMALSVESITSSLDLVREIDRLAERTSSNRRDEQVFATSNLDRLAGEVEARFAA